MRVLFLVLATALALTNANPTPNHDDTAHDGDHGHDHSSDMDHGHGGNMGHSGDMGHGNDHSGDMGHGHDYGMDHPKNGSGNMGGGMMHGGLCKKLMYKMHDCLSDMGLDEYVDLEKEYEVVCDDYGNFEPKQCHEFAPGEKWCACVDVYTGKAKPNTMTKGDLMCDEHGKVEVPRCPDGWSYYYDHYYEYCFKFFDEPKTWFEAEGYCQFEHGHLASVHCPEAEHFLQVLSRGKTHNFPHTWVGGTNAVEYCLWLWSDGMFMDYENFEKEGAKLRKDSCLQINHACSNQFKWGTSNCNETLPFICAKGCNGGHYYHY